MKEMKHRDEEDEMKKHERVGKTQRMRNTEEKVGGGGRAGGGSKTGDRLGGGITQGWSRTATTLQTLEPKS